MKLKSKRHSPVYDKFLSVERDSGLWYGYITIYTMSVANQSVLWNTGLDLSQRKRRGDVRRLDFHRYNKEMRFGD